MYFLQKRNHAGKFWSSFFLGCHASLKDQMNHTIGAAYKTPLYSQDEPCKGSYAPYLRPTAMQDNNSFLGHLLRLWSVILPTFGGSRYLKDRMNHKIGGHMPYLTTIPIYSIRTINAFEGHLVLNVRSSVAAKWPRVARPLIYLRRLDFEGSSGPAWPFESEVIEQRAYVGFL